jgi:putative FmdB family regulatory protein
MPTYEYTCSRGHHFEEVQRISDPPLTRCPDCKAHARRQISQGNFILKGGGWYASGYQKTKSTASDSKTDSSA